MNIVLNNMLVEITRSPHRHDPIVELADFQKNLSRRFPVKAKYDIIDGLHGCMSSNLAEAFHDTNSQGFLSVVSDAYCCHRKLEISPHDLWYVILTEAMVVVKEHSEPLRHLFTKSADKQTITLQVADPTEISIDALIATLKTLVPTSLDNFVPKFSTMNEDITLSCHAALCDGLQVYYDYFTMLCGIPEIRVTGTPDDWSLLFDHCYYLNTLFAGLDSQEITVWLHECMDIATRIHHYMETKEIDLEWWQSIFSKQNIGSGGEFVISGWIANLYYQKPETAKVCNFPSTLSIVPYENIDTCRKFVSVHGALKRIRTADGFMKTGYSRVVYEMKEETIPTGLPAFDKASGGFKKGELTVIAAKSSGSLSMEHLEAVKANVKLPVTNRTVPAIGIVGPVEVYQFAKPGEELSERQASALEAFMTSEDKEALVAKVAKRVSQEMLDLANGKLRKGAIDDDLDS